MTFKNIKQLEKEYDKASKKCSDNAYDPEKEEWNKEHFNRCDGDVIAGKLDQTEEIVKIINKVYHNLDMGKTIPIFIQRLKEKIKGEEE